LNAIEVYDLLSKWPWTAVYLFNVVSIFDISAVMMHYYGTRLRIFFSHSITTRLYFDNPIANNQKSPTLLQSLLQSPPSPLRERHKWNLSSCTTRYILSDCPRPKLPSSSSKCHCDVTMQIYYPQINFIHLFHAHHRAAEIGIGIGTDGREKEAKGELA